MSSRGGECTSLNEGMSPPAPSPAQTPARRAAVPPEGPKPRPRQTPQTPAKDPVKALSPRPRRSPQTPAKAPAKALSTQSHATPPPASPAAPRACCTIAAPEKFWDRPLERRHRGSGAQGPQRPA